MLRKGPECETHLQGQSIGQASQQVPDHFLGNSIPQSKEI